MDERVDPVRAVPEGSAAGALDTLAVKGRSAKDNYDRGAFGQAWLDVDRNGCDTRNDILRRDLAAPNLVSGSRCQVAGGTFQEPYTGAHDRVPARRRDHAPAVQIDHVVALGDAWQKGAQQLTAQQREHLANDPLNLIAVDGPANQDKSAPTPPPGCRPTRRSAATTWPARFPSRRPTGCGSRPRRRRR